MTLNLRAVLWDMDGTLINTEPLWDVALRELTASYGLTWTPDDAHNAVGQPLPATAETLRGRGVTLENRAVIEALSARVEEQLDRGSGVLPWMPGALDLLASITDAGLQVALVTNAFGDLARKVVAAVPGTPFRTVVAGDDVAVGKPEPDSYLLAAHRLGVQPAECVALEDSETGARAAEAAGIRTLVTPGWRGVPASPSRSRVRSLDGIALTDLQAIRAGKTIDSLD
ncbi:HAD superfamily hydrolase (TIGR01509 family) [Antricoccus suffuscus]|uniref:HAD superfamily hydrolase (TIGR01509 family) n=1 Tax=Antricoccus suffuscus TaxID=1629062 RepID=A0A2T1A1R2_9ACTN|nr:HAD family phosphatase [Antricoccus suffuscus]PRZ42536.1 HAD superfamily hydrolase (TIGR01509 family) [Antricoccus suffuscus]